MEKCWIVPLDDVLFLVNSNGRQCDLHFVKSFPMSVRHVLTFILNVIMYFEKCFQITVKE